MAILMIFQMPMFLVSVAIFTLENLFTYGVDGLSGSLVGFSLFLPPLYFGVLLARAIILARLGTRFFSTMEADLKTLRNKKNQST